MGHKGRGVISVEQSPRSLVKNHRKPSGSFIALAPGTMGGFKMEEACVLDPGRRTVTCLCPNTGRHSVTEAHEATGGKRGGEGALMWEKTHVCVCTCVRVQEQACVPVCVWGGETARMMTIVHGKGMTTLETPTEHLTSSRAAPTSNSRFSL